MVSDPGSSMEYSTGTSHILSAIITKATKTSTHQFATDTLARPIGITLASCRAIRRACTSAATKC